MIRRSTWIMSGVFILLAGFAYFWTYLGPSEEIVEPTARPGSPWRIAFSDVEVVEIFHAERGQTLELRRTSKGLWSEKASGEGTIDGELVEQTLEWLAAPMVNREISTEGGLEQFGLDEPEGIITMLTYDGESIVLLIGNISPIGNQRYTIIPNTPTVLLISNFDVNSTMDLVGMDLVHTPLPEESQSDAGPEVP